MKTIDLLNESEKYLYGTNVFSDNQGQYTGIVSKEKASEYNGIRKSGGFALLASDAPVLYLNIECSNYSTGNFPHIGISVQRGVSVSFRIKGSKQWYNYDCFYGREGRSQMKIEMFRYLADIKSYELMICFSNMCCFSHIDVSSEDNYSIEPVTRDKSMVFLGGKITFGVGVTTSSFTLPIIFARKSEMSTVNISMNSNRYLENLNKLAETNAALINNSEYVFIECDNFEISDKDIKTDLKSLVLTIISFNKPKIILFSQPTLDSNTNALSKKNAIISMLEENKDTFKDNLIFIDNYNSFSSDDADIYTYSQRFINDSGNVWLYKKIKNKMEEKGWNI